MSRPDIVRQLANGWTEEIKLRKHVRADGSQSRVRSIRDADGVMLEVWHEVLARDGTILHGPHLKYRRQEPAP
jgi:hypothetical protein